MFIYILIRPNFLSWQPTQPSGHAPSRSVSGVGGSFSLAEVQPRHGEPDADCSPEPALELRAVSPRRHPAAARASPRWPLPQRGECASAASKPPLTSCNCLWNNDKNKKAGVMLPEGSAHLKVFSLFIFLNHLQNLFFLPQIRSLRRDHVESTLEKEELVDHPIENGILHSPPDGFAGVDRLW